MNVASPSLRTVPKQTAAEPFTCEPEVQVKNFQIFISYETDN